MTYRRLTLTGLYLAICAVLIGACGRASAPNDSGTAEPSAVRHENASDDPKRLDLERFVTTVLSGKEGVYTNLIETDQNGEAASGHEVLSESAGLLMRYEALSGERGAFDDAWRLARSVFDMKTAFSYRFSPATGKLYPLNAAVDDLRIIRALYEAGQAFGWDEYTQEADRYAARFLSHNVRDGRMYDIYDEKYGTNNSFVTLCYIDLPTLGLIADRVPGGQDLLASMRSVATGGYLGDRFPFYAGRYDYEKGTYSSEGGIQTVESLLTILSLSEAGLEHPASISFLKEKVLADKLYGRYNAAGEAQNDIRSTALYAIAAMIGSVVQDPELRDAALQRMESFRVTDTGSPLYGGFGDPVAGQAYSFDNLTALLAYHYSQ
ncbi:glycosyl hydrolase family 8 [Cohnella zeiphila]|uniref:Glycosyl hydrolase n=1 Tax=Cohnella zeiphila TaxID=2761120 RepID=A0A7X0SN69_9BACL|nr:glycosyl hydrolase family 8 [Cohnella zeiphila]MBB6733093.1 hypothetical protein [Cohnella zeiphila]